MFGFFLKNAYLLINACTTAIFIWSLDSDHRVANSKGPI